MKTRHNINLSRWETFFHQVLKVNWIVPMEGVFPPSCRSFGENPDASIFSPIVVQMDHVFPPEAKMIKSSAIFCLDEIPISTKLENECDGVECGQIYIVPMRCIFPLGELMKFWYEFIVQMEIEFPLEASLMNFDIFWQVLIPDEGHFSPRDEFVEEVNKLMDFCCPDGHWFSSKRYFWTS